MARETHSRDENQRKTKSLRHTVLRCVMITTLTIFVAIGVLVLIIWLVIKPAPLEYTVENATIRGFHVGNSSKLNATFHVSLMADNRNKKVAVFYDSLQITVWYEELLVAKGELAPFYQPSRNASRLTTELVAKETPLSDIEARNLRLDRVSGKVEVVVEVKARIRFRVAGLKSRRYTLRANCSPVILYLKSGNDFQRAYCDVDL